MAPTQEARRRKDGTWIWTMQLGEQLLPYPPCTLHCRHETKEEAQRHHYEYRISQAHLRRPGDYGSCQYPGCGEVTGQQLVPFSDESGPWLCPEHCTEEVLRQLKPFASDRLSLAQ